VTAIRAEHIGSLVRPRALLDEVHRIYEAGHTALLAEERAKDRSRLHELEDEGIRRVVAKQEELGLPVVTDGEFRRLMYFNSFFDAVDGLAPARAKLQFRGDDGSTVEHEGRSPSPAASTRSTVRRRARPRSSPGSPTAT
jgi:5-methyltetrahydropteroyltriglutamate--homocysteine methyltransferase